MTAREKLNMEQPDKVSNMYRGGCDGCPSSYGYLDDPDDEYCGGEYNCKKCWDREIPEDDTIEGKFTYATPKILDSGARREFASGAVRDIQEGKGRCDLLPLDVVGDMLNYFVGESRDAENTKLWKASWTIGFIAEFMATGDTDHLFQALKNEEMFGDPYTMLLEVSKHFEEGCKKYGENNWQKGIDVHCYIDSAVRHYLKFLRGDKDEPHDRAFCWNILCAIWTCKHKPELNDYAREVVSETSPGTEDTIKSGYVYRSPVRWIFCSGRDD